mgnify:CR=1 FL=1
MRRSDLFPGLYPAINPQMTSGNGATLDHHVHNYAKNRRKHRMAYNEIRNKVIEVTPQSNITSDFIHKYILPAVKVASETR